MNNNTKHIKYHLICDVIAKSGYVVVVARALLRPDTCQGGKT